MPGYSKGTLSTFVASGTGDVAALPATPHNVLYGISIKESAAVAAAAELILRHGTLATAPQLMHFDLAANGEVNIWFGERGISIRNGLFVDRISGSTEINLFTEEVHGNSY